MNKILLIHFLVLASFQVISQTPEKMSIRIMTYNVWNGFNYGKDSIRRESWIKWIKDKDPDVLALQELCGYDEAELKAQAAEWGHPYVTILKSDGYPVGLTSRKPISLKERVLDGLWHGMLHCETYGMDFFVIHLSPADCDIRLKEATIITEKVKQGASDKYIILGDFNAHSPFDANLLKNNTSLLKKYTKVKPDSEHSNLRLGAFDYSVLSSFLAIPAIDVCANIINIPDRYTFPTPAIIGIWQTEEEVRQNKERIDYILTSPVLSRSCTHAMIYHDTETVTLSDHYPVMIKISFNPK